MIKVRKHTRALCRAIRRNSPQPLLGAEIGVWRGENAHRLLDVFPQLVLYLVDPYTSYHGEGKMHLSVGDARKEAEDRLAPFADRCLWLCKPSGEAHAAVADASLDFAFLDGNHRSKFVAEDIRVWLPKIKPGGILAGHDYGGAHRGVKGAVDRAFPGGVQLGIGRVWWVKIT